MMKYLSLFACLLLAASCSQEKSKEPLPILGNHDIQGGDTTYHKIPEFAFINQDSQVVDNETFAGKAYVADFFFTSCPTICPKVKKQMLRLYERYENEDRLLLLSHTIDPKRDSVGTLATFAGNLGVSSDKWHFVTGDKAELYGIADDYMSIAIENPDAPGGFDHSGWLLLIDGKGHIRSFCDGTNAEKVDLFMEDIDWLLGHM